MKRVLILEDNKKAALLVAKILKELEGDMEIVFATNCAEAKQQLLGDDFRLFVVDILLDGNNPNDATGLDFVQFLRSFKKYEYTPVVITTSVAEMKDHAYDNLDCYKYLEKPYDYDRAKSVLKKALDMPLRYDDNQFFHMKCDGIVRAVKYHDIVAIHYRDRKITVQMTNGILTAYYKSLTEVYRDLPKTIFLRCSKDAIVNKKFVEYANGRKGKVFLVEPYPPVAIGSTYKRRVIEELENA